MQSVCTGDILPAASGVEKDLMLQLSKYNEVIETSFLELAPHKICQYVYELANAFNRFYHDTKIIAEENEKTACFLAQSDQSGEGCTYRLYRSAWN